MQHSPQYIRKRKFLLMLPVLIVPFITLAFWALGGGKGDNNKKVITESGLDLELPGANVKNEPKDKLAFYDKAESDSEKFRSMIKDDPYFKKQITDTFPSNTYIDPNEAKVYNKIDQLNEAMNNASAKVKEDKSYLPPENNREAERLERMIQTMQQGSGTNPEMDQVNGMLEKILDIQHPDRVKEKMQSPEHQQSVFSVSLNDDSLSNQFYSLEDTSSNDANAIPAVIHETQTIVSGSTVKLRLLSEINIAGRLVPKDNFVYGIASLNGERLNITVKGVCYNNSILPVALSAYDLDGMEGIYIPGAITRDVAKQSTDNSLQQIGLNSPDPSIGMQAANAGIQAAKTILSKKVKLVKVTVKAGYKILLKDK
jgi:hypothetical protein